MRFLLMHKADQQSESGVLPPPDQMQELFANMGRLISDTARAGHFLAGEGLRPSSTRMRLTFAHGSCTVTRGPYPGRNELPAGFVAIKVKTTDEAIDWAKQLGLALGGPELELGPIVETWDLGVAPRPKGPVPLRFLILHKATPQTEAGTPRPPQQQAELTRVLDAMRAAGVLEFVEEFLPGSRSVRLHYRNHQRTVTDGPFAESKELIGGFCMVQMASLDEVLVWTDRFARILGGTVEVDVRPVADRR